MIAGIVVGAILAIACVLLVALPYLRDPDPESDDLGRLDPVQRRILELEEDRDRALTALKELEADHRGGRIADDDYKALVSPLRREAAEALRALDGERPSAGTESAEPAAAGDPPLPESPPPVDRERPRPTRSEH